MRRLLVNCTKEACGAGLSAGLPPAPVSTPGAPQDTMAPSALEKAEKAEAEACASLKLCLGVVDRALQQGEGAQAQLNARMVEKLLTDLESGLAAHRRSITELVVAAGDDQQRIEELTLWLTSLLDKANPLLDRLYTIQNTLKAADSDPVKSQSSKKGLAALQLKVRLAQKTLETRLRLLQDASKKPEVLTSSPMIQAKLKLLEELDSYSQSELDAILAMLASEDLGDADVSSFQTELADLIDATSTQISTLKERLSEAAALLQKPLPETTSTEAAADTSLTQQLIREMAGMRADFDSRGSSRSSSDFCFAKVPVPEFRGDVKEFTKWRSQVEDYLKEVARKSTQKAAVHMLDRLTPRHIDVSRCDTLTEAWAKLSSKFGSPTHIARLLLRDFTTFTLKKHTDEAKLIELRDALEKLESDLLTNGQEGRCSDFTVLDYAESLIPGRFRDQFVEVKEELVEKEKSGFKALTSFLEEKATMVERHLPDRLLDSAPKSEQSSRRQEAEKIKELKAKIAALEGKPEDTERRSRPVYNKKISEEKAGKCPLCQEHHYFKSTLGASKGKELASAQLRACPKYRAMTLDQKADTIVSKKACAACTDWRHDRSACTSRKPKSCEKDGCTGNHHTSLHGCKNPKIMSFKMNALSSEQTEDDDPENFGMLAMLHIVFKGVNQGTIAFIDEGSNTSAISTKLAHALYLQGKVKLTTLTRACERTGQTEPTIHHVIELTDRSGVKHRVRCMEVDYVTDPQEQPDYTKVYQMFPHLPHGCLQRPEMEVGLLLGQNATGLLPTGGGGVDCVDNLRVRQSKLGEFGWVLEGWHPDVWCSSETSSKTQSLKARINRLHASPEALFPDLAELPLDVPRSCPRCVGCSQCKYEVQDMSFREKKELEALREAVILDNENSVCRATYPELDPSLVYKDNKWQAVAMSTSLERQLRKSGMLQVYNKEFQDLLDRGVVKTVTAEQIAAWKERGGQVSYISHHPVLSPDKATTKCRLVANSSLKNSGNGPTPNQNWPKGPNALKPMYQVFVRFRLYQVAIHFDLSKMFHSVLTGEPEQFKRLMVWRNGEKNGEWQNYGWQVVAFGDRPASCTLEICKDLTAKAGEHIDPVAARAITEDTYVDDGATGGDEETAQRMIGEVSTLEDGSLAYTGTLSKIFKKGGFNMKMIVRSGETNPKALEKMGGTVLGHKWDPMEDTFSFHPRVFLGKKGKNGTHSGPELLPENLAKNNSFSWTKALVLSTVASIFDPSGIISAYTIKFKLFLREVCLEQGLGWDEPLPPALMQKWRTLVKELVTSPAILVHRCARPPGATGPPYLVIFTDGSSVAYAAVVYVVYKLHRTLPGPWSEGYDSQATFAASLLLSKARVAPLAGMTIPRTEMNGLILGTKMGDLALSSMRETPSRLTFCLDSECTIAAVDSENGLLKPYLANRRAVVKGKLEDWKISHPETEFEDLQHIAGTLNPADLPTRSNCSAQDVGMDSAWQNGPAFLQCSREQWPVSRDFKRSIPEDEIVKAMKTPLPGALLCKLQVNIPCKCRVCSLLLDPCQCSLCARVFKQGEDIGHFQSLRHILTRTRRIEKARGVMARVLRASAMLAKENRQGGYKAYAKEEMLANIASPLTVEDYERADRVILLLMQPQVKQMLDAAPVGKKKAKNPSKGQRTVPPEFLGRAIPGTQQTTNLSSLSPFQQDGIWYTSGRFGKELHRILGTDKLAVLPPTSELAHLLMLKAHQMAHMAGSHTCARSRQEAWIVRARPLADRIAADCLECRRRLKIPLTQRLGFLPQERMLIFNPPFTATAIDFLGPFRIKAMNNARSLLKVWPVVFGCLNTGATHIEVTSTYGTDALLLAISAFTGIRGYPATFYTDRGSQLCKAAQYVDKKEDPQNWGWDSIEQALSKKKSEVKFCLPGCQWQNGSAEQRVRALKDILDILMAQGSASLNYAEFRTLLVNCADRMNSRPLGTMLTEGDIQPLTPNHLLLGRTQPGVINKEILDEGLERFTKRAKYVAELGRLWWSMWLKQVFPTLLPFRGWVERQRNLEKGDIVMVETKHKLGKDSYRLARVLKTSLDEAGLCRRVTLEARPRGGNLGLPYISKDLEEFDMATQQLVSIHPHEAEMLNDNLSQANIIPKTD